MSANGAIHANFIIEQKKKKKNRNVLFSNERQKRAVGSFLRVELLRDPERKKIK